MRATDLLFSAVYIIAFLIAATQLSQLAEMNSATVSAKLFPWLVVGTGLAVGVIETLRTLMTAEPEGAPTLRVIWSSAFARRRMVLLGLFILYLVLIKPVGFLIATAAFIFGTTVILTPRPTVISTITAALVSAGTLGLIYVLLVIYLEAFLP